MDKFEISDIKELAKLDKDTLLNMIQKQIDDIVSLGIKREIADTIGKNVLAIYAAMEINDINEIQKRHAENSSSIMERRIYHEER